MTHVTARLGVVAVLAWLLAVPLAAQPAPPAFNIQIERAGVYRVGFEDLRLAEGLPGASIGLSNGGEAVPLWVHDGGDGVFGPGDWLEFVGERLRGEYSYSSEYSRFNVYKLRFDQQNPKRMRAGTAGAATSTSTPQDSVRYRREQHLEQDVLILRLPPAQNGTPEEIWYWAKLVHNRDPFRVDLDLGDLESRGAGTVDLRIHLRGWSVPINKPTPQSADHRVEVVLNGEPVGAADWNGTQPYLLEVPGLDPARLVRGTNALTLKVPQRDGRVAGQPVIDVVMLNWVEVTYPRAASVGQGQAHFTVASSPSGESAVATRPLRLESAGGRDVILYGDRGSRLVAEAPAGQDRQPRGDLVYWAAPDERAYYAASPADLLRPVAVVPSRPPRLAANGNQADYIMIVHPSLRDAVEPLAALHRARGLAVMVVDIEDVYDEFNHGVVHPRAIRAFLGHAYDRWTRPAPRWVLLVGDASWDARNENTDDANYADWTYRPGESEGFAKNGSTLYAKDAAVNRHGLIPTWNYTTDEGHSASDNYFVGANSPDDMPRMAIGRLPVVEPQEVAQIVAKTVRYVTTPEVGPWRRNALFITNEDRAFQQQSDKLALGLASAGLASDKVYPASTEASNEHHTKYLIETLDQGQLFVHFLGHGGRYIWQTGPPDLKKNHDLFTLDDLEHLAPTGRLPIVLSLTCYSAPFDHPSADSIGEKLLRLGDRGAIAVFAASWRNVPLPEWGRVLLQELTVPGVTVGEAVTAAKRRIRDRMFVETYNLLGDPAVPVALPAGRIVLDPVAGAPVSGILSVRGVVELPSFAGQVVVDVVDASGTARATVQVEANGPEFRAEVPLGQVVLTDGMVVRAYAWNASKGIDAVGAVTVGASVGSGANPVLAVGNGGR